MQPFAIFVFALPFLIGFTHVQTPQFARGSVFPSEPSAQQLHEQDKYKGYLKEQVNIQAIGDALLATPTNVNAAVGARAGQNMYCHDNYGKLCRCISRYAYEFKTTLTV